MPIDQVMARRRKWWGLAAICVLIGVATAAFAAPAGAEMRSTKLGRHLCKTVHGGRFVAIPGFPGEKIDRRLIPDIRWMKRHYDIFITDGYSNDPVHAENGEHPIGLATDIVPNRAVGGTWGKIGELAHLAEPSQNHPIAPWRWVGWNGDPGHGRGNHLHLSWMHSPAKPGHPARVVYTRRCPGSAGTTAGRHHRHRSNGGTGASGGSGGAQPPNGGVPANAKVAPAVRDY